jgi:TPR repeat protein
MTLLRNNLAALALALSVTLSLTAGHAQTPEMKPTFKEAAALYSDENYSAAYEIAAPLATSGDVNAQIMLGEMYEFGKGRKVDMKNAMQWYEMAAAQNNTPAMFRLAMLNLNGAKGVAPNPARAREWFSKAAQAGHLQASNELGLLYYQGKGVETDPFIAAKHIRKAADAGFAQAQYNLGLLYVNGHGVEQNITTASQWFQKAAVQGLPEAALDYGLMVYGGDAGLRRDYEIGAQWLMVAANAGNANAQLYIARILAAGRGMKKDRVEAAKFYILAKQEDKADADLDVMMSNLSSPQMGDAQRRARIFAEDLKKKRLNPVTSGKTDQNG